MIVLWSSGGQEMFKCMDGGFLIDMWWLGPSYNRVVGELLSGAGGELADW